jgi:hypothetical protein
MEIDRFPLDTRVVTIRTLGAWEGAGAYPVPEGDATASVLLLPFGVPCAVADSEVRVSEGAAIVPLPDGGLLIVGGEDGPTRLVRIPPPGGGLAEVLTLFDERSHASATRVGERVVIAGGREQATWEVFDLATGVVDRQAEWRLPGVRSDHGAVAAADGSVWLVGGRDRTGESLASLVRLDLASATAESVEASLTVSRAVPQVLTLDDGRTFVAGDRRTGDAIDNSVEWLDTDGRTVGFVGAVAFDLRPGAIAVALPGARIAWLGGGQSVEILSFESDPLSPVETAFELPETLPTLEPGSAVVLADGDVLAGGFVVDLGAGTMERRDLTSGRRLVALADGSIAELGAASAAFRREHLRTPFDNPPATLLPSDTDWLALDAAPRWSDASLPERSAYLPTLRFERVRVVTVTGGERQADLFLRDETGTVARVVLFPDSTEVGLCTLDHAAGDEVIVERDAGTLVLRASGVEQRCDTELAGPVALSWKLFARTSLAAVRIERL